MIGKLRLINTQEKVFQAVRSDSMILIMFNKVLYKFHLQVKYFTSCGVLAMILNRFNEVLYKLH